MSTFITRCPHCETSFNITEEQLRIASGTVRCGFCLQTFSALEHQLFLDDESEQEVMDDPDTDVEGQEQIPENIETESTVTDENSAITPTGPEGFAADSDSELKTYRIPELEAANEDYQEEQYPHDEERHPVAPGEADEDAEAADTPDSETGEAGDQPAEAQTAESEYAFNAMPDADEESVFSTGLPESDSEEEDELQIIPAIGAAADESSPLPEQPSEETAGESPQAATSPSPDEDEDEDTIPEHLPPQQTSRSKRKEELESLGTLYDDDALDSLDTDNVAAISDEPVAIHGHRKRPGWVTLGLLSANFLLVLALAGQYVWSNLADIMQQGRFPALTDQLCSLVTCPQINRFDLSMFITEELVINSHPSVQNALQVDFIFRNDADYAQAFPLVELNFMDINRRPMANRLFSPDEYLQGELQQFDRMPANSSVQVRLEIADPGPAAINYTLALRTP